jgi:hypothetical protein
MDIDLIQAQWLLDLYPADQIPEFAAQALMQGFEGPNILELVSFHRPTRQDIRQDVFDGALREMGRAPISRSEAELRVGREMALKILRNQLSPAQGVAEIRRLTFRGRVDETSGVLTDLGYLLDSMEGEVVANRQIELAVIEWAWGLVNGNPGS